MVSYRIVINKSAKKEIKKLPLPYRKKIVDKISRLAKNPLPANAEKIKGVAAAYRLRQGVYRVIYTVDGRQLVVCVVRVAHRREVYRNIPS